MKNPPILVSVLGFFGVMAGFYWIYLGLRVIGFDWFGLLGDLQQFEQSGIWGWLALGAGIGGLAASVALWALQPWAWLFANIMCGLALFGAFVWFIEYPGTGSGFSAAIMPLLILWYLHTREIKAAFGVNEPPAA